jgi:flagellar protein FlbD
MIMLTRLSGSRFVLNSDLIERVDATPDTVISLTDGTKYVVSESLTQVIAAVRAFRSEIVALSAYVPPNPEHLFFAHLHDDDEPHLAPVSSLHRERESAGHREHGES